MGGEAPFPKHKGRYSWFLTELRRFRAMSEEYREFIRHVPLGPDAAQTRQLKISLIHDCLEAKCWPAFDFREEKLPQGLVMRMRSHPMYYGDAGPAILRYRAVSMLDAEEKRNAS